MFEQQGLSVQFKFYKSYVKYFFNKSAYHLFGKIFYFTFI